MVLREKMSLPKMLSIRSHGVAAARRRNVQGWSQVLRLVVGGKGRGGEAVSAAVDISVLHQPLHHRRRVEFHGFIEFAAPAGLGASSALSALPAAGAALTPRPRARR